MAGVASYLEWDAYNRRFWWGAGVQEHATPLTKARAEALAVEFAEPGRPCRVVEDRRRRAPEDL